MRLASLTLLLSGSLTVVSTSAETGDPPLTRSARQLLGDAGLGPETFLRATEICKRDKAKVGGVEGTIAVDSGSFDCGGSSPDIAKSQAKTVLWASFQADIPVTNCISLEQAEDYLLRHGWRQVSLPMQGHIDLTPITVDYIDGAGATLALAPYLRNTCLAVATLRIDVGAPAH